ncbi:toxin Cry1Ac domain D-VI-related protein [Peribacillus sp. FSL E2-0218]|uniref:toxin Cry1Ac domain D-VI-related protein n=1 Tax=Peribacillus sp. FSL E2-0218 TaxID=2921364 RepID=UPI0030EB99A2
MRNVTVKDLKIKGKNYYGFITIDDASKNVEQVFENVSYLGPQMIWNRYGKAIFKGTNVISITNDIMPGSSPAQEMAEVGSIDIEGDTKIFHNNGYALIWSISKTPQFKIAPDANVEIKTGKSGYGIFYPTEGNGDFTIGKNAKVNFDGLKGVTGKGILKSFIIESGAEVEMNRTGTETAPMILAYGATEINENSELQVSTENGHAIQVVNVGKMNFKKPEKVILSSINGQAIDNLSTSLTMNIDTGMVKLLANTSNSYVSTDGKDFTWNANYRYDVATPGSIVSSQNLNPVFNIELGKTKSIELGRDVEGQANRELAEAKNKVENLFTDGKFDTLKGSTNQAAIDEAQNAVNKLPAGSEKNRLQDLVNKAKDLLNKNEQAEKELNDAKNKVEDLFTDDKFDTLKGSTNQGAIDEAKEAVDKLPAGPEKERLEELLNNAQDLLNKNEQAEKDLNDAKNKVEDLFTDDKFDTLKGSTDQGAIDEAKEAVDKLPAGPEKERLEELLNNAQDLLNKNEQVEKDLNDAKNKVEDLFTDDKFNTLKETTNQGAIDTAQEAVNKLPGGAEKDRLQDLLNKAKDLLDKDITAPNAPRLDEVTTNSKEVTGSGEPEANVTVTINSNNYTGVVGPDGKFKVAIPNQPVNTIISVTLTDAAGNVSKSSSVRVVQFMPSEPVKIDPVYPDAQTITGTAPEGATVVRLLINGVPLRTAPVNQDGTFSIYSRYVGVDENGNNITLQAGDIVTVDYGLRTPSNLQANITVVKEAVKLQVNPVAPNADYVTGIAPEGTQNLRLIVNGKPLRTVSLTQTGAGVINPDGSYRIYSRFIEDENGVTRRLQAGDVIEVDNGPLVVGREVAKTIVE